MQCSTGVQMRTEETNVIETEQSRRRSGKQKDLAGTVQISMEQQERNDVSADVLIQDGRV